ncbi:TonB-dependent receptor [Pedobacter sp. MC2016-14]|uniref:SusC/RagA family TonB-linked outer membrane protein n=1 Tax=Pedobacter sp. MC2016-14 TaxID=2897327 RepID=UPI001E5B9E51|nr:TonB-dependent receptor [Pedobacter sp. MC2016-14]MCD0486672.1 TonB-dependent receptor [Pedobacter sp. MC2016-14]
MMKNQLKNFCSSKLGTGKTMLASLVLLLLFAAGNLAMATVKPPITVKGTVRDAKGVTLIGVSVKSSAGQGATTDSNGAFTIATDDKATLTFSYIGYTSQTISINGRSTINVTLAEAAASQLNDVVVVGYGTQKRKDVTGAITTVKFDEGPKSSMPFMNVLEALQGTSGINVGPSTAAGAAPNIVVRGQNSISSNNKPLIVLDGVIFNGELNEINMNDVATFDILKDASAASIYGSQSQSGVVIITTKRGKTDKPQINFSTYYGIQNWTRVPKMKTGEDFIQWRKDNLIARGNSVATLANILQPLELQAYNEGHTLDWMDEITQHAPVQNYELSVSGRTDKLNYYFSAGYLDQKGVLYNDRFTKPNLTMKLENNITDWLSFGANAYYSSRDFSGFSPNLYMATYMPPYSYRYLPGSNDEIYERYPVGSTSLFSPFWGNPTNSILPGIYDDDLNRQSNIRGTGFINAKIPFIKGLNYRFEVTGNKGTVETAYFHHEFGEVNTRLPANVANPLQFLSRANGFRKNDQTSSWLINSLLSYTRTFGSHNFDVLAGYTRDHSNFESVRFSGADFAKAGTTSLGYNGLNLATTKDGLNAIVESGNVGYFARLNYNYKQRYYATLNVRRDGNSAFAEGHKYGVFPGGSVAWAMSEEDFMKKITFVDYLKVRLGLGKAGNQAAVPYETLSYAESGNTVFGSTTTTYSNPANLGNRLFTWEKTLGLNFGVDFQLLDNRLSGNIDLYRTTTTDQLLTRLIPSVTGYNSVKDNVGEVRNQGIEITLNTVNLKSDGGFTWGSGISFWMNRNKLVHLYGLDANKDGIEDNDVANGLFIGKSLGANWDYTVDGIVQTTDVDYMNRYLTATGTRIFVPGDLKIRDLNDDGLINELDKSIVGYAKENFNFNISNTFSYKNFQLFFSVNAIVGGGKNNFFSSTNVRGLNPGAVLSNIANWLDQPYWTPENGNNEFPRPNYPNTTYNYGFYQSRTFVRLQTASLSYTFPRSITEKLKVDNLKAYVSGTNLITLTGWTGLDPANGAQIGGNGGSSNGNVNLSNPLMRAITFGINLAF